MSARTLKSQGFTLVEILIVVVILGILAAIVIPQFTSASESARASSLSAQLQTIRSQLELYQIQHNGDYPTLANLQIDDAGTGLDGWQPLTTLTEQDGTIRLNGAGADGDELGPYLQKAPNNAFTSNGNGVQVDAFGNAGPTLGWLYDEDSGEIKAVLEQAKAVEVGLVTMAAASETDDPDFATY